MWTFLLRIIFSFWKCVLLRIIVHLIFFHNKAKFNHIPTPPEILVVRQYICNIKWDFWSCLRVCSSFGFKTAKQSSIRSIGLLDNQIQIYIDSPVVLRCSHLQTTQCRISYIWSERIIKTEDIIYYWYIGVADCSQKWKYGRTLVLKFPC